MFNYFNNNVYLPASEFCLRHPAFQFQNSHQLPLGPPTIIVRVCNRSDRAGFTSQTDRGVLKSVLDEIKTDPTSNFER